MANLIIIKNNYRNKNALSNVVNYVRRYNKTGGKVGAQGVMLYNPEECMRKVQEYFCKTEGKHVQHFILSFDIKENIAFIDLMALGYAVCALFPEYQLIFGVHDDKEHVHIHWAMNPVNMVSRKKFNFTHGETFRLRNEIAGLLEPYKIPCNLRISNPAIGYSEPVNM